MGGLVRAAKLRVVILPLLGSWRDCSAQFLVGLIRFNYNLPGWVGGDKLREENIGRG